MAKGIQADICKRIESNPSVKGAIVDEMGNALISYLSGEVELELVTESKPRRLGHIKDKMLFVERSLSKHLHRKSNSYGFNYYLLKKAKTFDWVCLMEDGEVFYIIPKSTIIDYGKVMNFKNAADGNSFELQIFLSRDIIIKYKKPVAEMPPQTMKDGI